MHANAGLFGPLDPPVRGKRPRYAAYASRGAVALAAWSDTNGTLLAPALKALADEGSGGGFEDAGA